MARKTSREHRPYRGGATPRGGQVRASVSGPSPFAILGVPRDASYAEVKQAYRRLAARRHPDAASRHDGVGGDSAPGERETAFHEIQQAYRTLQDRYARARWEREEEEREQQSAHDGRRIQLGGELQAGAAMNQNPERRGTSAGSAGADAREGACGGIGVPNLARVSGLWPRQGAFHARWYRLCALGIPLLAALAFLGGEMARPVRRPAEDSGGGASADAAVRAEREMRGGTHREMRPHLKGRDSTAGRKPVPRGSRAAPPPGDRGGRGPRLAAAGGPDDCWNGCAPDARTRDAKPFAERIASPGEPAASSITVSAGTQSPLAEAPARADLEGHARPRGVAQALADEWRGRWVAYCLGSGGTDLYHGSLEVGRQARFHWLNLGSEMAGDIEGLDIEAAGNGGENAVLRMPQEPRASSQAGPPSGGRRVAALDQDESKRRRLRWRGDGPPRGAPEPVPCAEWWIAPRAASGGPDSSYDSRLEGIWVLPSSGRVTEGSYLAEYAELRIERKGDRYDGGFVGRYAVPAAVTPREVRFAFHGVNVDGWHTWKNDMGGEGDVLLAPLGPSRLGVIWKRRMAPGGRPQLSAGMQVLSRMD